MEEINLNMPSLRLLTVTSCGEMLSLHLVSASRLFASSLSS